MAVAAMQGADQHSTCRPGELGQWPSDDKTLAVLIFSSFLKKLCTLYVHKYICVYSFYFISYLFLVILFIISLLFLKYYCP